MRRIGKDEQEWQVVQSLQGKERVPESWQSLLASGCATSAQSCRMESPGHHLPHRIRRWLQS